MSLMLTDKQTITQTNRLDLLSFIAMVTFCSSEIIAIGYVVGQKTIKLIDIDSPNTITCAIIPGVTTFILESSVFTSVAVKGVHT
jgi:hypothetical protein